MAPVAYLNSRVTVHAGDCIEVLASLPENSVDSVVCDPPYHFASIVKRFGKTALADETQTSDRSRRGIDGYARAAKGFMGKTWDGGQIAHDPATWAAVARVMKPGAHLVAFHAPKNWHRQAAAIEDAGIEIRDNLLWLFGSGFPKSHNLKGQWRGYGTALKPAYEPIVLARKPLIGTVAANVLQHGTGAINVDGCRVQGGGPSSPRGSSKLDTEANAGWMRPWMEDRDEVARREAAAMDRLEKLGRWPANVVHDGSEEVIAAFPDADGAVSNGKRGTHGIAHEGFGAMEQMPSFGDSGSAARFFYSAKADSFDRIGSKHPTVKPVDLMQWLCRLITPSGGTILDPFAGTGTTGEAAWREGFNAILIEREAEYLADIERRMGLCLAGPDEKAHAIIKAKGLTADAGPLFEGAA
jgi:site-specific DNA-methyltransferase (adenine-specific)